MTINNINKNDFVDSGKIAMAASQLSKSARSMIVIKYSKLLLNCRTCLKIKRIIKTAFSHESDTVPQAAYCVHALRQNGTRTSKLNFELWVGA